MSRTSRIFCPKIAIFSQFLSIVSSILTQAKQIIYLLLLDNFYPAISYRRVQKENDKLLYTVWSLLTVRNQLPTQVVKEIKNGGHCSGQRVNQSY